MLCYVMLTNREIGANTRSCNLKRFEAVYCGEQSERLNETVRVIVRDKRFDLLRRQSSGLNSTNEFKRRKAAIDKRGHRRTETDESRVVDQYDGRSTKVFDWRLIEFFPRHVIHLINQTSRSQHATRK